MDMDIILCCAFVHLIKMCLIDLLLIAAARIVHISLYLLHFNMKIK